MMYIVCRQAVVVHGWLLTLCQYHKIQRARCWHGGITSRTATRPDAQA